jgi:GWxTD domain-containing protein
MSQLAAWIQTPLARALGWTLVHFLWEGAVLGVVLAATLRVLRAEPARQRYAAACIVLAAMPAAFAGTLAIWMLRPVTAAAPLHWAAVPLSDGPIALPASRFSWALIFDRLAWLVPVWLLGVAFFYARGLAGWAAVRRLRHRGVCAASAEWQARLDRLAERLRLSRPVALLESCLTDTPVLIGYLRPAILLPLGCLTGLSVAQVECILLHELAHVARRDYVVNLLQSLVEGLLFYHPAVWWVSRVVRAERENCCDDRVVELMGDARAYAATLAALEERRALVPQAALAANGGNLMKRIRRLTMESRGGQASVAPAASAAVLLVLFAAALTALPARLPKARHAHLPAPVRMAMAVAAETPRQADAQTLPTPYRKWLAEDVAYIITDEERAAFLALTSDSERENFIEQFWKRRDPTPDTEENEYREEHYRRIAYTNEHFAGSVAGWKTDRGRMYIVYGPPDEIGDHSTVSASNPHPNQQWRYRYIDGIGTNVIVEFVDRDGTGDFHMTKDPSAMPSPYRKWLNEDAAYIVTPQERAAFQSLTTDPERAQFIDQFWRRRGPAAKAEHYRRIAYANQNFTTGIPGWKTDRGRIYITYGQPDSIASYDGRTIEWTYRHIEGLGNNVVVAFTDSDGSGEYRMTKDPNAWADRQLQALQKQLEDSQRELQEVQEKRATAQVQLAQKEHEQAALEAATAENLQRSEEEVESRLQQLQSTLVQLNQQTAKRQEEEKALESARNSMQLEIQALAESLKPLQPGAEMGVRVEPTGPQKVTVHVPLDSPGDRYHLLEEVRTPEGKIVHLHGADPTGSEFSQSIVLSAGKYRLVVVVKNLATGATRRAYLDFTVD